LFLGVHGMSARAGFTTPNLLEAETNRELVASAHRLAVLADHTKWGTVGISTIAQLSEALVGPVAVAALGSLNLDVVFLGVHGMTAAAGFTTPNMTERDTNRALVDAGQKLVVVADHTKWGTVGISTIAELGEADVLVTDEGLAEADRAVLEGEVDRLIVAQPGHPGAGTTGGST
ncbi:MAG: hypothetical protein ABW212_19965, partial [Pseudonocardia sediminis]